jgi:histidine triad (HIT) family protein
LGSPLPHALFLADDSYDTMPRVEICPFCVIAAGGPDDDLIAIRTRNTFVLPAPKQRPRNRGHILIIPNAHVTALADVAPPLLQEIYGLTGRVSIAVRSAFGGTGAMIFQNEKVPDQLLHHIHIHVVPRTAGDEFKLPDPIKDELSRDERRHQAIALRRALAELTIGQSV